MYDSIHGCRMAGKSQFHYATASNCDPRLKPHDPDEATILLYRIPSPFCSNPPKTGPTLCLPSRVTHPPYKQPLGTRLDPPQHPRPPCPPDGVEEEPLIGALEPP
jgi:hypothetical protein